MSFFPKSFMNGVVSISKKIPTVDENWGIIDQYNIIGTWFFFGKKISADNYQIFLVTNRHVIEGQEWQVYIKVRLKDWSFSEKQLWIYDDTTWVSKFDFHPNPKIDIAVTNIDFDRIVSEDAMAFYYSEDISCYKKDELIEKSITEWDGIFVLWYPSSLMGNAKFSVVRRGIISQITPFLEWHTKDFIIDSFTFPWNSWWPVIVKPEIYGVWDGTANTQARLIGILKWYIPYRESLQSTQTWKILSVTEQNSWLTVVESIDSIIETINNAMWL